MRVSGNFARFVVFIFICFICSFYLCNPGFTENKKLPAGEKLFYDVYWKFLKVGYGTFEVKDIADFKNRKAYCIHSTAQSAPFFDVFFKVRDTNISWIDAEKFRSLAFEQHISEGKYKRDKVTDYDQEKHEAVNNKGETFEIPLDVLDVLGALYWVRLKEIKPGDILGINVNSGKKNYQMNVKIRDRKKIKVNGKKYKTILVEPDLKDAGIFMNKGKILIWMTDDERHIPVKMIFEISVGSIVAELNTEEENVKH